MFFCFDGPDMPAELDEKFKKQAVTEPEAYFELYKGAGEDQIAFDGTTAYLYRSAETINNMERYYGNRIEEVKIIILLRNPIDRAWSHYNYLIRNGFENLPFVEAIKPEHTARRKLQRWGFDYTGFGAYFHQVKAFKERFPLTRVYLTEDLKTHDTMLGEIFDFLDLPPINAPAIKQANPSGVPKNRFLVNQMRNNPLLKRAVNMLPEQAKHNILQQRDRMMGKFLKKQKIDDHTRALLTEHYREDITNLGLLIERDLSHWLKTPRS